MTKAPISVIIDKKTSSGGIRLVQAFTNERYENDKFRNINDNFRATKLKAYNYMSWNITISLISKCLNQTNTTYIISYQLIKSRYISE